MNIINNFLFGVYPYIALTVFLAGSLLRFDRDQYTWKSDSSQMLKMGQLRLGQQPVSRGRAVFVLWSHLRWAC
jgi:nitrate reductase gamma subunit